MLSLLISRLLPNFEVEKGKEILSDENLLLKVESF